MVRRKSILLTAQLALVFSGAIEQIQHHINPFGDFSAFWADFMNAIIGISLAILLHHFTKQCARREKNSEAQKDSFVKPLNIKFYDVKIL